MDGGYGYSINLPGDSKLFSGNIDCTLYDEAGNISTFTKNNFMYDDHEPTLQVSTIGNKLVYDSSDAALVKMNIYAEVGFSISASDYAENYSSDIESVCYRLNGGTWHNASDMGDNNYEVYISTENADIYTNQYQINELNTNGINKVEILAYDKAGNASEIYERYFLISADVPVTEYILTRKNINGESVELSKDDKNIYWTNSNVNVELSDSRECIAEIEYSYSISCVNGNGESVEVVPETIVEKEDNNYSFTINIGELEEKYIYEVKINAINRVNGGRFSRKVYVQADCSAPQSIFLLVSGSDKSNVYTFLEDSTWYTDANMAYEISVDSKKYISDRLLDTGSVYEMKYKIENITTGESSGDCIFTERVKEYLVKDGIYVITTWTEDLAGNCSKKNVSTIHYDSVEPTIDSDIEYIDCMSGRPLTSDNIVNGCYVSNNNVAIDFTVNTGISGVEKVEYSLVGDDGYTKTLLAEKIENNKYRGIISEDFRGKVILSVTNGGGVRSKEVETSNVLIDSVAPVINFYSSQTQNGWTSEYVYINASMYDPNPSLGIKNYYYSLDSTNVDLENNKLCVKNSASTSAGIVAKAYAMDFAGNYNLKTMNIFFDNIAPVITLSGINNGEYTSENKTLMVCVLEQIYDLNKVSIDITKEQDGVATKYSDNDFNCNDILSARDFGFNEEGTYKVLVSSVDAAGNKAVTQNVEFTIDKTAPKIEIQGIEDNKFYNSNVELGVKVIESNYSSDNVAINVTRVLDGEISTFSFNNFPNDQKESTLNHVFSEDGEYTISVVARDKAGNQGETVVKTFTIDKTAPQVDILGIDDYEISSDTISIKYHVVESNYNTNSVTINISREDIDGNVTDISSAEWNNINKVTDISQNFYEEGRYCIVITAVDQAGNESTTKKNFIIDISNPIIKYIDEIDGQYYQSFKFTYDINKVVKDLTVPMYKIYMDGMEYDINETITSEGKHTLKIEVTDELGHYSVAKADFIVDSTPPRIIVNGIEDGFKYTKPINITISTDNDEDTITNIFINGEEQSVDKLSEYTYVFNQYKEYTIYVRACDLAGNIKEYTITCEHIKKNVKIPIEPVVCGFAISMGAGLFILLRRRVS